MPRRLPVRPAKVLGNCFVLVVMIIIIVIYYTYMFVVWGPRAKGKSTSQITDLDDPKVIALLIVYNLFFVLLLWSFFQIDAFKPDGAQATVSPCACLLKIKAPTRTAPPEASDGDPKIVADLSKKVATAYVVSQKSARLSDSMGKKNKKKANLAASFAESMGELSDGE